jgi:hypothetical protein
LATATRAAKDTWNQAKFVSSVDVKNFLTVFSFVKNSYFWIFFNAWYLQTWTCWFRLFLSAAAERMMLGGNPGSFIVGRAEGGDPRSGQGGSTLGILSWSRCGKIKRRWELTGAILATRRSSQVSFAHSHL